jgi:hypothetical protein
VRHLEVCQAAKVRCELGLVVRRHQPSLSVTAQVAFQSKV